MKCLGYGEGYAQQTKRKPGVSSWIFASISFADMHTNSCFTWSPSFTEINVLCPAGIELIFTRSWLGWPKQPVKWDKWDILYHVMPCSLFKWGAGRRRGFCYLGVSWASGGENTACCVCFLSVLLIVVFFSLCRSVKLFSSEPTSFCLFPSDSAHHPTGVGGGVRE